MDINFYRDFLKRTLNGKSASGGKEVVCRCRYCPDGRDRNSAHMYISIPKNPSEPSMFYCQLCHSTGIVNPDTLTQWGVYDSEMAMMLLQHNKGISKKWKTMNTGKMIYHLINNYIYDDKVSFDKLAYINNRLGINMTFHDVLDKKIVLNLGDVLQTNNLRMTRDPAIVNDLDKYFMGFISFDNAFVNMRKTCEDGIVNEKIDKRYINYNLFNKLDNTQRFYTMPTQIDISYPQRIPIHIAEGPFDILSIYYNLRHGEYGIYTSVSGSNYKGIINHFICGMKLPFVEIHIYPDNDKYGSNHVIRDIYEYIRGIQCPLYVHRNTYPNQKDFGVDLGHIEEAIKLYHP